MASVAKPPKLPFAIEFATDDRRDIDDVMRVEDAVFGESDRMTREEVRDFVSPCTSMCWVLRKNIVGLRRPHAVGYMASQWVQDSILIQRVAVLPEYRRIGLAKLMITEAKTVVTGWHNVPPLASVRAFVPEDNQDGIRLFLATGFTCRLARSLVPDDPDTIQFTWTPR